MGWDRGYYGQVPLFRARFAPCPRVVQASAWIFNPLLWLDKVNTFHVQVV